MPGHPQPTATDARALGGACGIAMAIDIHGRPTHDLVATGLEALRRLTHRGACAGRSALIDGAGVLVQIPWAIFDADTGAPLPSASQTRAMLTLFTTDANRDEVLLLVAQGALAEGWLAGRVRPVPVNARALDPTIRQTAPLALQIELLNQHSRPAPAARRLWRLRIWLRVEIARRGLAGTAVISASSDTTVYKALVTPEALPDYYTDLSDPRFESAMLLGHQRFATNVLARWDLAQPFGMLAHNGEINTVAGNRLAMRNRLASNPRARRRQNLNPADVVTANTSDSSSLDDAVHYLVASGLSLAHAMTRLVPPAWENDQTLPAEVRAFHEYQALCGEPWEGPAALGFSDGRVSGALVDKSGFRPLRWLQTRDGRMLIGSEAGIYDVPAADITGKGRVGPGEKIVVDAGRGRVHIGRTIYQELATHRPYVLWNQRATNVAAREGATASDATHALTREARQRLFACDSEEIEFILRPLAETGAEAVGSMGDDAPLAAMSSRSRLLTDYFRQRFAQVTNPPLDSVRERMVMSLRTTIGRKPQQREGARASVLVFESPVLSATEFSTIQNSSLAPVMLPATFDVTGASPAFDCARAIERLAVRAVEEVKRGAMVVILSDRGCDREHAPLPSAMAVAAVFHALVAHGLAASASIVVETGDVRDAHQLAVVCSLGAAAVFPYVGDEIIEQIGGTDGRARYRQGLDKALLKILARMGVATFGAYLGAHLVETIGLRASLTFQYFRDVPSVPGSVTLEDLIATILERHRAAIADAPATAAPAGLHRFRRDGEFHAFNPEVVRALHRTSVGSVDAYEQFATLVDKRAAMTVRDLVTLTPGTPISIDEVEGVEAICRRFFASAMSIGALGPEAHRTIAQAMHLVGGRSNSGEGGEDAERQWPARGGASTNSLVKQVASARFGVTPAYLLSAEELQIKIAQGAKPGEGGQLPAAKVVDHIARLRHVAPGTPLVSPPPHHDIYSIEDLAELIFDLQTLHPAARIGVKLVAGAGVGVIAAGVAKAGAHAVQISGYDGGTGAAPRAAIKHTGWPWEVGLLDAHVVLTASGLRSDVVVQIDGGLKTGLDVAKAAALGADEFGFGTSLLVASGCVMARQCHANTCPVGIATQRKELRAKFQATPDQVANYLWLVAGHVRQILADLGIRTLGELVGRLDLVDASASSTRQGVNAARLVSRARRAIESGRVAARPAIRPQPPTDLNARLLDAALPRLGRLPFQWRAPITNADRAVGAGLAGVIASRYGDRGSPQSISLQFDGTAGQSFGSFLLPNMTLDLVGDANDGVAKSMHGGRLIVRDADPAASAGRRDVKIGNGTLYGATGGELFVAGAAGDRFAVRNSGAVAVVEGVGDHGCEYMTAGCVVVLGTVGRNFGAGMTGGVAYVTGRRDEILASCHSDVVLDDVPDEDWRELASWIERHAELTGSPVAAQWLAAWREAGVPDVGQTTWMVRPVASPAAAETFRKIALVPA